MVHQGPATKPEIHKGIFKFNIRDLRTEKLVCADQAVRSADPSSTLEFLMIRKGQNFANFYLDKSSGNRLDTWSMSRGL